ncbi:hypothetical protein NDU88_003959 [Pleurodeles waltl]|uniref:Reverse transcriptase RNase H-like domain-containing protein n=1 Tax=Pleurodeles waltl TaxID=8319 RepID=A0AAV7UZX6_PLEWA|nr:hypothetical protein NDU88_003959 [Pleurodeles waltl]
MYILSGDKVKYTTPRTASLTIKLLQYAFDVKYITGKENVTADHLSMLPIRDQNTMNPEDDQEDCFIASVDEVDIKACGKIDWKKADDEDVVLK